MTEQHSANIDAFARDYLLIQDPPRGLLNLTTADVQKYLQEEATKTIATSFKRFFRFLEDTARLDYEQVKSLQELLKQAR